MLKSAIVVGAHTMGLGVIRALGVMQVPIVAIHYDPKDMGHTSKYVKESVYASHPEQFEEEFLTLREAVARRYPESVLFPVSDASLRTVSKHKQRLSHLCTVACAECEITEPLIAKHRTYALASTVNVPIPRTEVLHSIEDVERHGREAEYPCLVKPCWSHQYY